MTRQAWPSSRVTGRNLAVAKKAGKLVNLSKELAERPLGLGTAAIGHTRWATHGPPTDVNAHPHLAADGRIAIIHNGIIENYSALRAELVATGVTSTPTPTPRWQVTCLAHYVLDGLSLADAMRAVARRLEGAFTLLAVDAAEPHVVVGTRRNSPLVAGIGEGENFLGSDVVAFIEHTRMALELDQDEIVEITPEAVTITRPRW